MAGIIRTGGLIAMMLTQLHCSPVERQPVKTADTNGPIKSVVITYGLYNQNGQVIKKIPYAKGNLRGYIDTNSLAQECKFKLNLPPRGCEYKPLTIELSE